MAGRQILLFWRGTILPLGAESERHHLSGSPYRIMRAAGLHDRAATFLCRPMAKV
jgi:hypothetical protein